MKRFFCHHHVQFLVASPRVDGLFVTQEKSYQNIETINSSLIQYYSYNISHL